MIALKVHHNLFYYFILLNFIIIFLLLQLITIFMNRSANQFIIIIYLKIYLILSSKFIIRIIKVLFYPKN